MGKRDLEDQGSVSHREILGPRNSKRACSLRAQRESYSEMLGGVWLSGSSQVRFEEHLAMVFCFVDDKEPEYF